MPFIKLWLTKILNTLQNSGFSFPLDFHFKNLKKGILGLEEVHRSETMMVDRGIRLGGTSGYLIATSFSEQSQLWDQTTLLRAFPV